MKVNYLKMINFLILLNLISFVRTSTLKNNNQDNNNVDYLTDTNLKSLEETLQRITKYEQNIQIMEEKIKSFSETFNNLDEKITFLINDNMKLLENNLHKVVEQLYLEETKKNDDMMEQEIKPYSASDILYHIQELKCPNNRLPESCDDLNICNSNIYSIMIPEISNKSLPVVCDFNTLDGGWTVIQRRQDGSENFNRNWTDYVNGFGDLNGEFFIGLEKLHILTTRVPQELYIILEDFEGVKRYARYGVFRVDSISMEYKLTVGQYNGNAGDCLYYHNGSKFSTHDRDNDNVYDNNMGKYWKSGWWHTDYWNYYYANLNGLYLSGTTSHIGLHWYNFRGMYYSLKYVQMMIRPKKY